MRREKTKIKFQQVQVEKNYFLGEFKENIILAVRKQELDGKLLREVVSAMKREDAVLLKISRSIPLKKIKIYIDEAEKIGIKYRLVDGLSFAGDVGLVVVSNLTFDNEHKDVIWKKEVSPMKIWDFRKYFQSTRGKNCAANITEWCLIKFPPMQKGFDKLDIFDRLLGKKCPICEAEKKGKQKE